MASVAACVERAIRAAGVPITGLSLGRLGDKATWRVEPAALQAAAQPHIDAFDPVLGLVQGRALEDSRREDLIALVALMVRGRDVPGWQLLTTPQKFAAVQTELVVYRTLREFIDGRSLGGQEVRTVAARRPARAARTSKPRAKKTKG